MCVRKSASVFRGHLRTVFWRTLTLGQRSCFHLIAECWQRGLCDGGGISSASKRLRCLYLLHSGGNNAEPISFCIACNFGIHESVFLLLLLFFVLFCFCCPTQQMSIPQQSGLNPVHLCSYEAKEFLFGLILLMIFSSSLNSPLQTPPPPPPLLPSSFPSSHTILPLPLYLFSYSFKLFSFSFLC